jgi:predicted nucleic acid-binding protein
MTRIIVPDTTVLGAAYFAETHTARAEPILRAIREQTIDEVAPTVFLTEFANVCRKKINEGVDAADADIIFEEVLRLPILWWESIESMAQDAWNLHRSYGMGTNDAYFFLLAQSWDAELWTLDSGLYESGETVESGRVKYLVGMDF